MTKDGLEKVFKLCGSHFSGGHLELPVLDGTEPAHVTIDRDIIGGIGKNEARSLAAQQFGIGPGVTGISAEQSVITETARGRRALRPPRFAEAA